MTEQNETPQQLREAADKGRRLERENAFLKAGIDTDDARMRYFVEGYKGELTKEAIVAEATAAGFVTPPAPPATETPKVEEPEPEQEGRRQASAEEQEFDAMAEVGAESAPAGTQEGPDELKVGWDRFTERRNEGARREDASSEVLGRIVTGAIEGDKRFIV